MCKCHKSQAPDYIGEDSVKTNAHYNYLRSYARIKASKDGYSELFIIHSLRASLGGITQSGTELPAIDYGLRLVRLATGELVWKS